MHGAKSIHKDEFCIQGLSGFNTLNTTPTPVSPGVRYAVTETFKFDGKDFKAIHVNALQSTNDVQIQAITQIATSEIMPNTDAAAVNATAFSS